MHVDPEFDTFTYGDPTPPKRGLRRLQAGDLLAFYAGLEPWPQGKEPAALYLVGYFDVALAGLATEFSDEEIVEHFAANAHVRHPSIFREQRDRLVLVKGGPGSRLLDAAMLISETATDRSGRPLKVLSRPMRGTFGDFDGHVSIQRSPPRWVATEFADRAAEFVRALR
jgi:hypothetical protein